jgi:nucleoside-diphosphate-sugar epimerase
MQIAVTGGRGLLGRSVVTAASQRGHRVVSIDLRPVGADPAEPGAGQGSAAPDPLREGGGEGAVAEVVADVTSYDDLKRAVEGCDALVHLAARPAPFGWPAHEVHNLNVVGSYNALSVAVELSIERICLASSVNAIGAAFSRRPHYDYFPVDEEHATYNEDPYSLSKWVGEAQAASVCRRHEDLTVGSLRLHHLIADRALIMERVARDRVRYSRDLWGYITLEAAARACLAVLGATWKGHEVFFVVSPRTALDEPTEQLCAEFYPQVPRRQSFPGNAGLFRCTKAAGLLGWEHDATEDEKR